MSKHPGVKAGPFEIRPAATWRAARLTLGNQGMIGRQK
jgi:hypothetical protein